jgi:hypothetical protein
MGRRNDDDAFYWRSIRLYKVNVIRYALQRTNGVIKAAAVELGISEGGLRKEITALEGFGLNIRDESSPPRPETSNSAPTVADAVTAPEIGEPDGSNE